MDINLNMKMFAIFRLRFRSAMLESMEKSLSCAKGSQNLRQSKQKEIGDFDESCNNVTLYSGTGALALLITRYLALTNTSMSCGPRQTTLISTPRI